MGWDMYKGKPHIYNWNETRGYYDPDLGGDTFYFTWQTGNLWAQKEEAIKYTNDTGQPVRMTKLYVKTCACDSDGQGYWSSTGFTTECKGYGAKYSVYVRVSNDGGKTFKKSKIGTQTIPSIEGTGGNMNTPGTGTSVEQTARFGYPPYTGNKGLILREYDTSDCPIIEPNGIAYIHLKVSDFTSTDLASTTIQFILDPDEMEIVMDGDVGPYVWRFCEDNKWHLVRPLYIYDGSKWKNVEEGGV